MAMENGEDPKKQEEFSFLQETFKDEQPSGKKLFNKISKIVGLGLVFGLAASLSFYAIKPWAETLFKKDPNTVTIPEDKKDEEQPAEDEQKPEPETPILTIDNYRELNRALYQVGMTATKSVVQVTGIRGNEAWLSETYDTTNSAGGIFVADNGQEVLILTFNSILKDAKELRVTFADGTDYTATLKKADGNLGLAVLSVPRGGIKKSTWSQIQEAVLGNSNSVTRGDGIIALGTQFGYSGGMGYGIISSTRNNIVRADGEYAILCTDISAVSQGTGVLVNIKGEVIGMIDQSISGTDSMNLVTAYAISDIKTVIEKLSNGYGVPYVGIIGTEVTKEIADQQGIPQGVYVKEVRPDSPAMKSGIKSGDIIVRFNGKDISSVGAYHRALMECVPEAKVKVSGQRQGSGGYVDVSFDVNIGSK